MLPSHRNRPGDPRPAAKQVLLSSSGMLTSLIYVQAMPALLIHLSDSFCHAMQIVCE